MNIKNKHFNGNEILHVAEAVSRDKGISKESIIETLEEAISITAKRKYGTNVTIKTVINRKVGTISLHREMLVVEDGFTIKDEAVDGNIETIEVSKAREIHPSINSGETIKQILPPLEIGRLNAISVKQVVIKKVKELEKNKIFDEYKNRVDEIVNGVVEKIETRGYIVKIGSTEAMLKKEQTLKTDFYKLGDRIKAYLVKIDREASGPILLLSRTHENFVVQLFKQEVPEIYDRIIEVKKIARDPGSRSKIAVYSSDPSIDAIGSCIGMRGIRVQTIIKELKGEKIDIVKWSNDPATFIVNALGSSIRVSKVIIDEEQNKIEVIIPEDEQSQAIGRRGQNIKLISELIGWRINILTEELEAHKRQEEFNNVTKLFMEKLNLEEILAQLLASEGFISIQNLADADITTIANIEGLDETVATELISRSKEYIDSNVLA